LKRYYEQGIHSCTMGFVPGINFYSISIYNLEKRKEKILTYYQKEEIEDEIFKKCDININYLIKNEYLFVKFEEKILI